MRAIAILFLFAFKYTYIHVYFTRSTPFILLRIYQLILKRISQISMLMLLALMGKGSLVWRSLSRIYLPEQILECENPLEALHPTLRDLDLSSSNVEALPGTLVSEE